MSQTNHGLASGHVYEPLMPSLKCTHYASHGDTQSLIPVRNHKSHFSSHKRTTAPLLEFGERLDLVLWETCYIYATCQAYRAEADFQQPSLVSVTDPLLSNSVVGI